MQARNSCFVAEHVNGETWLAGKISAAGSIDSGPAWVMIPLCHMPHLMTPLLETSHTHALQPQINCDGFPSSLAAHNMTSWTASSPSADQAGDILTASHANHLT